MHVHPFLLLRTAKRHQKNVRVRFLDSLRDCHVIHLEQGPKRRRIEIDRESRKFLAQLVCGLLGCAGQPAQQKESIILPRGKTDQLWDEIGTSDTFWQRSTE